MSKPLIAISHKQAMVFACFLVLYEFLTYIANDMIMPGMIHVVQSFNAPESAVATSLTVYILGGASLQLILGPISDAYGRRAPMLVGAVLFFLFTLLIASSHSIDQFLTARFFQGMGLCFISVIGYATIQEIFDEMDAIRLIAIMANAAVLAPLLGPVLGAITIHYTSWRVIFIIIAGGALIAVWGLWKFMPEPMGQVKNDGTLIPKIQFSLNHVAKNYKALLSNPSFCFSTIAISLVTIPCLSWIALAPIIMIAEAKLTVIQYGLWQLPIFGSTILGNWTLHRLTYKYAINHIIYFGCAILTVGILLIALLPYFYGNNYLYLLPGIIIYFFSLSIVNAPLNRFSLFSTSVSKGTTSALLSLSVMIIGGLGIEVASRFYQQHINLHFGLYCNIISLLFLLFIGLTFWFNKNQSTSTSSRM
jgi:DHA1 family multidrug/chloramphenicol efflux transport protein-like MFS transporter